MIEQQCSHVWTWRPGWTRNICQKCGESEPLKELAAADPLRAELYDALRKRVAELEALFSHVGVETHKWLDPECGHEGCQSLVLKARAEQAEAQLNQTCGREHDAKERCAELEKQCAELSGELEAAGIERKEAEAQLRHMYTFDNQHRGKIADLQARAERAEAERDVITEWVIMIENRLECAVQGDEICKGCVKVAYSYAKEARAALNPPPAGREG